MTDQSNSKDYEPEPVDPLSRTSDLARLRKQLQKTQPDLSAYERLVRNAVGPTLSLENIENLTRPSVSGAMQELLATSSVSPFANLDKFTHPSIFDGALKQLNARIDLTETTRRFAELTEPSAALAEVLAKHQPFLAALAFDRHRFEVPDLAKLWDVSSIRSDARSIVDAIQSRKGPSFEELFRPPKGVDFALLDVGVKTGSLSAILWGKESDSALRSIGESLAKMQAKLVETGDASRSIRAFVELQGLGTALRTFDGFSSQISGPRGSRRSMKVQERSCLRGSFRTIAASIAGEAATHAKH